MIVNHIREEAERQGFTAARLSRRAGLSEKTLYGIFGDRRSDMRVTTLLRVAKVLQVDPMKLVELVEDSDEG